MFIKKAKVQVQSIDNIFQLEHFNKIDLLKIDTEGFEYEVLMGCKQSIKNVAVVDILLHRRQCIFGLNEWTCTFFSKCSLRVDSVDSINVVFFCKKNTIS